ncbi:hypothetical protein F4780DRAFT_765175 [Xylariomycetidae sp. FL0641]|nr:hypothetical protein F4780DRAFT_765175 [Xylariomycetidae sp. FL0641]
MANQDGRLMIRADWPGSPGITGKLSGCCSHCSRLCGLVAYVFDSSFPPRTSVVIVHILFHRGSCTMSPSQHSQVIFPPSKEAAVGVKSVFLAGTTNKVEDDDWRERLSAQLAHLPVTIFNPFCSRWDSSWNEDISCEPYREQVEWELEKQEQADVVVVYFHPKSQAPISLLELGLCVHTGKAIVVCPQGYWKRGNVQIVCRRHGIMLLESVEGLKDAIVERFSLEQD